MTGLVTAYANRGFSVIIFTWELISRIPGKAYVEIVINIKKNTRTALK